jgi:hypothetical protein
MQTKTARANVGTNLVVASSTAFKGTKGAVQVARLLSQLGALGKRTFRTIFRNDIT